MLEKDNLVIDWPHAGKEGFIDHAYSYLKKITESLGGQLVEVSFSLFFFVY